MAWALQAAIEESIFTNSSVAGSSMDLTKAFNLTPRDGLYCIVKRLGWPESVMKAHSSFLHSLQRFFCLDGGLYNPCYSSVGVPEGCPISVIAMMAISWFADARLQAVVRVPLHSYVDNWSLQH